jgi:hypothetical protein
MAYDESLAERIRPIVQTDQGADEKKMFGALVFLIDGNMACGVTGDNLIVRLDPAGYEAALARPGASVFDLTGKVMKGWLLVDPSALEDDADLEGWVHEGMAFARSLPPK